MRYRVLLVVGLLVASCTPLRAQQVLTLQEALSLAGKHSPRLQTVQARREESLARARAVSAMLSPQVSVLGWLAQGTGGQLQAQVREAVARERAETAISRTLQLQVGSEIRQAWLDIQTAAANLATADAALKDAEEAYRIATLRVQEGKAPFVEQWMSLPL